ncbi:MAG TPA: mechanosensitive ion channel domain-containing protein [Candidatus Eisenbacteria bacterium]|nr:mechanosensitive ion channel domain-containing protein [Candidatus Eisenbacteria bacterium]
MENILETTVIPIVKTLTLAIIVLIAGIIVIKKVLKFTKTQINKSDIDETLKPFLLSLMKWTLYILLTISVISILGVPVSSLIAVLASAGFAIGLAFQGSLSNFAGGVLLLLIRPIRVGDYIDASGHSGTVEAVDILNTTLRTVDNRVIYIPNGDLSNSSITNYSIKDTRRVDLVFGVAYEEDSEAVKNVLTDIIYSHPLVLKDPEPFIRMSGHGDSAIEFTIRAWTKAENYWDVHFDLHEMVKKRFDKEGISIPYPQIDLHMAK